MSHQTAVTKTKKGQFSRPTETRLEEMTHQVKSFSQVIKYDSTKLSHDLTEL